MEGIINKEEYHQCAGVSSLWGNIIMGDIMIMKEYHQYGGISSIWGMSSKWKNIINMEELSSMWRKLVNMEEYQQYGGILSIWKNIINMGEYQQKHLSTTLATEICEDA